MKTGHQIIEEALNVAGKRDWGNSPFSMSPSEGIAYQDGLASAYLHALEMIPDLEEKFKVYESILKKMHETLDDDGYGWWIEQICVKPHKEFNDEKISFEDFLNVMKNQ